MYAFKSFLTMTQPPKNSNCLRLISGLTLGLYFFTQGVCPPGYASERPFLTPAVQPIESVLKGLPESLGRVAELWVPPKTDKPFILFVQDAHGQTEAQRNTEKLLKFIDRKIPLTDFFIEGGAGKLNPEKLRLFKETSLNLASAQWFLREGDLGGVELFLLGKAGVTKRQKNPAPLFVWGAEDRALYLENLKLFQQIAAQSSAVDGWLSRKLLALEKRASRVLNPELLSFFKEWIEYEQRPGQLESYLAILEEAALNNTEVTLSDASSQQAWPMLVRFSELKRRQALLNFETAFEEAERLCIWAQTKGLGSQPLVRRLRTLRKPSELSASSDLRGQWEAFYQIASPRGFSFDRYPSLSLWQGARMLESEMDARQLLLEAENLRGRILDALARQPQERRVVEDYRNYLLLEKLLKLRLERSEFEKIVKGRQFSEPRENGSGAVTPARQVFNDALKFYATALGREQRMSEVLWQSLDKPTVKVFAAGGFHTQGVTEKLREAGVPYAVVSPHMSRVDDESRYWNSIAGSQPLFVPPVIKPVSLSNSPRISLNHVRIANLLGDWNGELPLGIQSRRRNMFEKIERAGRRAGAQRSEVRGTADQSPETAEVVSGWFVMGEPFHMRPSGFIRNNFWQPLTKQWKYSLRLESSAFPGQFVDLMDRRSVLANLDWVARIGVPFRLYLSSTEAPRVWLERISAATIETMQRMEQDGQGDLDNHAELAAYMNQVKEELKGIFRSEVRSVGKVQNRTLKVGVHPDLTYEVKMSDRLFDPDNPLLNGEIKGRKVLVVADENIGRAKLKSIRDYLRYHGVSFKLMTLPGGEQVKDGEAGLETVKSIMLAGDQAGLSRKDLMILVGGGAVLDVGGFAASIAHRGIPHVRIPTTLLAQIDAGIGVKNGINFFGQKNFAGVFRPPQSVLVDPEFLNALSERQMRSGMAEAIKVALMKDAAYFELIEEHGSDLIQRDFSPQSRARDIMWLSIVRHLEQIHTDPFETKLARPLDYGHEWGHRLEMVTQHAITHGEGVAIGTAVDTVISWQRGYISKKQLDRVLNVIEQSGLPVIHPQATTQNLWPGLESFRIHLGGRLTISLLGKIGQKRDTHRMEKKELSEALVFLRERAVRSEVRSQTEPSRQDFLSEPARRLPLDEKDTESARGRSAAQSRMTRGALKQLNRSEVRLPSGASSPDAQDFRLGLKDDEGRFMESARVVFHSLLGKDRLLEKLREVLQRAQRDIAADEKDQHPGGIYLMSSPARVIQALRRAEFQPGQTVMDLGHGTGEVLFTAGVLMGARGIGAEWNDLHFRRSVAGRDALVREGLLKDGQVELRSGDFSQLDFRRADYLFYYSSGASSEHIPFSRIISEMKPGAKLLLLGVQVDEDEEIPGGGTRTNYYQDFTPLLASGQFDLSRYSSPGVWIYTKLPVRSEVRSLPEDWESLNAPDLFSPEEKVVLDWRMSYLDGLWSHWDVLAQQMVLTPSFLLMLLGAKPAYISTTSEESLPGNFFGATNERFRNDLGYGLFNEMMMSPIAFSLRESAQTAAQNAVYLREQGLQFPDEDSQALALLARHPYWNWQDVHILYAKEVLSGLFAQAVKETRTWDVFMGLIAGYPPTDVHEYVRLNGRELGHQGVLENFMDYRGTEFASVFFWTRKEGSPEAGRQKERFRAALYYAYAGLRHHADFEGIANQIHLPETVHTAPAPQALARSELRKVKKTQIDSREGSAVSKGSAVLFVARFMTAKIVRISDLSPQIVEMLFPRVLRQPEAKLPEPELREIKRFYTALFKQGSSIILPASLLIQSSSEVQRDYLELVLEALRAARADYREPFIHITGDQGHGLKNLFFASENWKENPSAEIGTDLSRAVKFWTEPESVVAQRLEKEKVRFAAAVTKSTALKARAFLVKPETIRKLTRIQRVIFQARLTQLLQAASALNEEEFAQLSRELGLNYQIGEAIVLNPSTVLSSIFAEQMNAIAAAVSA